MDLLFREESDKKAVKLSEETIKDVALCEVIDFMSMDTERRKLLKDLMASVPCDPQDIIFRQEITKDFLKNEALCTSMTETLDGLKTLIYYGGMRKAVSDRDATLYTLLEQLRELSVYVTVIEDIFGQLKSNDISSAGLISLRDSLEKIITDEKFSIAKEDIKTMLADLSVARGAIIGVNLTPDLSIEDVTAIEFVPNRIRSAYNLVDVALTTKINSPVSKMKYKQNDPLLAAITPKLEKHLKKQYAEIKRTLAKYTNYDSRFLTEMFGSLTFYLKTAEIGRKLQNRGYEITFPEIGDSSEGRLAAKDFYNIRLAIKGEENIVKNDFAFTDDERIFILTGPNRGGKTILEQGLGLMSVMMSLGMFVTAGSCAGRPFTNILTHYPIDENLTINYGRLGEEAIRIKELVKAADEDTLLLFNETFSTTSATDGLYLSKELIHVLKERGAFVIFNTHIHDLAKSISEMDGWAGKSKVISIVMERKNDENTFILKRAEPDTTSFAKDIAVKYGITYEQMTEGEA